MLYLNQNLKKLKGRYIEESWRQQRWVSPRGAQSSLVESLQFSLVNLISQCFVSIPTYVFENLTFSHMLYLSLNLKGHI